MNLIKTHFSKKCKNRLFLLSAPHITLNFAQFYLFLNSEYQTINRAKFIQNLNIRPIRLNLYYFTSIDIKNQPLFKIQNNNRFNINVFFNIPKTQFLNDFYIPSLKSYKTNFDTWFKSFFKVY